MKNITKARSYRVHGPGNLIGLQDKKVFAKRKKIFQQGFSDAAVRKHEEKVLGHVVTFCDKLLENDNSDAKPGPWTGPKNINLWCT
jgi:cytochrome P450